MGQAVPTGAVFIGLQPGLSAPSPTPTPTLAPVLCSGPAAREGAWRGGGSLLPETQGQVGLGARTCTATACWVPLACPTSVRPCFHVAIMSPPTNTTNQRWNWGSNSRMERMERRLQKRKEDWGAGLGLGRRCNWRG